MRGVTPLSVSHPSQHLNGLALIISIGAGLVSVLFMIHQIDQIRKQSALHEKEAKLLDLQIQKHEQDIAADAQPKAKPDRLPGQAGWAA